MPGTADYAENHRFAACFTVFAALSQGVGGALVAYTAEGFGKTSAHMMSFSAGVMLYLSFMDIMVAAVESIGAFNANVAFFVGIAAFLVIEYFVPEADIANIIGTSWEASPEPEPKVDTAVVTGGSGRQLRPRSSSKSADGANGANGSSGRRERKPSKDRMIFDSSGEDGLTKQQQNAFAFAGAMAMITISLHNLPEGIAVYLTCLKGVESGLPLAIAMALHNIPEGMAVAGPIYAATKSRKKAAAFATFSGLFEVVGAMLMQLFFDDITPYVMEWMLALVAGVMVALTLIELLPSTLEMVPPKQMALSCSFGMFFMFCSQTISKQILASWFGSN
jgi:ZIP family zinc transporter